MILGSTGSIGTQVLDVVERLHDRFKVIAIAANSNVELLAEQAARYHVENVCVADASREPQMRNELLKVGSSARLLTGVDGMCTIAQLDDADLIIVSVAGAIGIAPTHAALGAGKDIALASKEVLVAAGEATMALARANGCQILPIDSEHSAIFQCLQGAPPHSLERIFLTASGGPFRKMSLRDMESVTPQQALRHPTWNMGGLVTINSATLMNKALEVIEARWLFDVPVEAVEVVVHPQSIIHSMVRLTDGSTLAQLGLPDMRLPIQYALVYPERLNTELPRMNLTDFTSLTFEAPDHERFPALKIAEEAVKIGKTAPAVMNAANEAAVAMFLNNQIPFLEMAVRVRKAIKEHDPLEPTLENVIAADKWARKFVESL